MQRCASSLPEVDSMGRLLFDPIYAQKDHTTPCCEMFHIIKGRVRLALGNSTVEAQAGDTLLIPAEKVHRDEFDLKEGLEVFMVFFSWQAEKEYFLHVNNSLLRRLPKTAKLDAARMFDRLRLDRSVDDDIHRLLVRSRVLTILLFLLQECIRLRQGKRGHGRELAGTRRRQSLMLRAKEYLENHFHEPVSLNDIARELRVSPFYLSHVFGRESDFSLFNYLTALRMNRARELLAEGKLNVAETARTVGYDNSQYFAKVFRQHFGHAPIGTANRNLDPFTRRAAEPPE